ncbi:hypothetical protein HanRHA438_Chr08g0360981 [Helianthus annuus]|nr:hypothetical protein HanRHA438_Chr08g0360981 [Helianthus annuus]
MRNMMNVVKGEAMKGQDCSREIALTLVSRFCDPVRCGLLDWGDPTGIRILVIYKTKN